DAANGLREAVASDRDEQGRDNSAKPDAAPREKIDGKKGRRDCAAEIDREDDLRSSDELRDLIDHAEERDLELGDEGFMAERGDRDVDVGAEERDEKQQKGGAGAHAELHVGVAQHPDFDDDHDDEQQARERSEALRRERQILRMAEVMHGSRLTSEPSHSVSHRKGRQPEQKTPQNDRRQFLILLDRSSCRAARQKKTTLGPRSGGSKVERLRKGPLGNSGALLR